MRVFMGSATTWLNLSSRLLNGLSLIIISIITARFLGPELRGEFGIYLTLINAMGLIFSFSVHDRLFASDSLCRKIDEAYRSVMWMVIASLCLSLPFSLFYFNIQREDWLILLASFISLAVSLQIWEGLVRSLAIREGRLNLYNIVSLVGRGVSIAAVYVAAAIYKSPLGCILGMSAGCLTVIMILIWVLGIVDFQLPSRDEMWTTLASCMQIHVGLIGAALISQGDQMIIGQKLNPIQLANYQIAGQVINGLVLIPLSFSPLIMHKLRYNNSSSRKMALSNAWKIVIVSSIIIIIICYVFGEWIYQFFFGKDYKSANIISSLLIFSVPGKLAMGLLGAIWINSGYIIYNSLFTIMVGLIAITANWYLAAKIGTIGVATIASLAYLIILLFNAGFWYYWKRKLSIADTLIERRSRLI